MGLQNLKLGTDNDLAIEGNNFVIIRDFDYTAQKIKSTLQTFYGEWWINVEIGIPYYEDILVKNPDLSLIRNIFTEAILDVYGVIEVLSLELERQSGRTLLVTFTVRCSDGSTSTGELIL